MAAPSLHAIGLPRRSRRGLGPVANAADLAVGTGAEVQAAQEQRGHDALKQPARRSTTDPDARQMKRPDGGTRPAFNVPFATDTARQVIVGVDALTAGTDSFRLRGLTLTEIRCRRFATVTTHE